MRRWFSTAVLGAWTAAVAACGSTVLSDSCAGLDSTMFIAGCLQVPRDTCVAQASPTAVFQEEGTLAPLVATRYVCSAQVENQIGGDAGHASIQLLSATVRLLVPDTGEVFALANGQKAESTFPITGLVPPANGADPGVAVVDLVLMDTATVDDLVPLTLANGPMTFQAQVLLQGRTLDGQDVTSQEFFLYPITVVGGSGCVVPPGAPCVGGTGTPAPDCLPGQDELDGVDCRLLNPCSLLDCKGGDVTTATCPPDPTGNGALGDHSCCSATCFDMVKDGTETDVDCGGASCPPCASGEACEVNADCASRVCEAAGHCL